MRARFSLFHEGPQKLDFRLHFGALLGAKFATFIFVGHPGRQQPPQRWILFSVFLNLSILGSGRGGAGQGWPPGETPGAPPENPPPPHTTRARSDNLA